jgi:hypothetical protein
MTAKPIRQTGPEHPSTIKPNPARVVMSLATLQ